MHFTEEDVRNALRKAKTGKACGLNNIYMELIKLYANADINFFVSVFNFEINNIDSPKDLYESRMVPIKKAGAPNNINHDVELGNI